MLTGIGRFTRTIATDLRDAVQREKAYSKGEPLTGTLYLTYRCTSRCRTCKMWSRSWNTREELSVDQWMRATDPLIDAGVNVMEIFGGDVLLRKDVLVPLIQHLKRSGVIVHIPTNSNLLDGDAARMLVDSGVDHLYLSTDGVESVHDTVRGVEDTFGKVQRAAEYLATHRKGQSVPRLICNTTVSKYNAHSLDRIAGFAADAGFDEIHFEYVGEMTPEDISFSAVDGLEPTPYYVREDESVLVSPAQTRLLKKRLSAIHREYLSSGFGVSTMNIDCLSEKDLVEGSVPKNRCYTERCEVTVDPGGNVVACPFFHSFTYGNLLEEPFEDIWWGGRHRRFHMHLKDRGLLMCRHCILSIQRNHSFSMRLKRIYLARLRGVQKKLANTTVRNEN